MACKTSYDLHHNFPKLAEETGFAFNTHRPRVHIDWNKIRLIDIESLARDRKFILIEQHVNDILDCVLESEFDVRILDEGVVKLFRLAQLAVEYQQFCRHYLDRSVFVLRHEIDTLTQELASTKKDLQVKEEELRKLRKKGKHNYRPLLSYSNDNIATMILQTLTNKSEIFPSTATAELHQYNRCTFCDKVFLNPLYLKSHISRRHVTMLDEVPQKDEKVAVPIEVTNVSPGNLKLTDDINELKLKLKEMESLITANRKTELDKECSLSSSGKNNDQVANKKEMNDVEVYTNNDDILEKLEEWKKTEQENHTKEINLLRNQIFETLNSFRVKENNKPDESDLKIIDHLRDTIREQGAEILALKQALTQVDVKTKNEDKERKKEIADQMLSWAKRDEMQSKQYEILLQKMNEVSLEARESRTLAEAERHRAEKLETMLKKRLDHKNASTKVNKFYNSSTEAEGSGSQEEYNNTGNKDDVTTIYRKPSVDQSTMEKLHRKAQELLNIKSSSSSDISSADNKHLVSIKNNSPIRNYSTKNRLEKDLSPQNMSFNKVNQGVNKSTLADKVKTNVTYLKKIKSKKRSPVKKMHENGPVLMAGSPLKVVRAKITEEVNNRLVEAGVDPLKSRLHHSIFQKQKSQLLKQTEIKSKKYPTYEQLRYTIMAYLDSNAANAKRESGFEKENTNSNDLSKVFSLSSMISNVKSKALSLVKSRDTNRKSKTKAEASELVKKAAALLKAPAESPIRSDVKRSSLKSYVSQPVEDKLNEKRITGTSRCTMHNKGLSSRNNDAENQSQSPVEDAGSDTDDSRSPYKITFPQRPSRSIDNLIKSPVRRPSSANADYSNNVLKYTMGINDDDHVIRSQSVTNVLDFSTYRSDHYDDIASKEPTKGINNDIQELLSVSKVNKDEDSKLSNLKQTKGVLKNASSTSSLNKKKVLFDMDATQMKSVSASPSQSLTEKSDEKYELGLVNIDNDEWDISSIENEPIKQDTKIEVRTGQSLKITELKQTIEAQLSRRSKTASTALFGVDVLRGPGGSNTSLGSSILDESDNSKQTDQKTLVKPKKLAEKDDSELDLSDFSIDELTNKNERDSF